MSKNIPETIRGGFTLEAYGSSNADGLDAIQIEIETTLRTDASKRGLLIEDLAFAISGLIARYADSAAMAIYRTASFLPSLPRG